MEVDQDRRQWLLEEEARVARRLVAELRLELERTYPQLDDALDEVVRLRAADPSAAEPSPRASLQALSRRVRGRTEHPFEPAAAEPPPSFAEVRRRVAERYLSGDGIEIGALNEPLQLPPAARVRFVDRMSIEELRSHYPELDDRPVVAPDVVADGETLAEFDDASLDFIVANHFIEHCQDPIGTLEHHLRALRDGGILYLAVPDKRRTFDAGRPVTTLEHVLADHRDGPAGSRWDHFLEWAIATEGAGAERALELSELDYSVHFHVWTPDAFLALLTHCERELGLPFELAAYQPNDFEFVVVLRRTPRGAGVSRPS